MVVDRDRLVDHRFGAIPWSDIRAINHEIEFVGRGAAIDYLALKVTDPDRYLSRLPRLSLWRRHGVMIRIGGLGIPTDRVRKLITTRWQQSRQDAGQTTEDIAATPA